MLENKEELKNKIIYRASYRGTKEMDILMIGFVNSIIHELNLEQLNHLNNFVNMDDETLISIKNGKISHVGIATGGLSLIHCQGWVKEESFSDQAKMYNNKLADIYMHTCSVELNLNK